MPGLVILDKEAKVMAYLVGVTDEASLNEIVGAAPWRQERVQGTAQDGP